MRTGRRGGDMPGLPPDVKLEGSQLKLTVVAGTDAIEVSTHFD